MADGTTTNYGFTLPEVGASEDTWGTKLNQNWTDLDADLDALQDAIDNIELFPQNTAMLFAQTTAPTGWTKSTTHNDKALRLVSGTASSGGSSAFTTAFGTPSVSGSISGDPDVGNLAVSVSGNIGSTTLSVNQIPSHSHREQVSQATGNFAGVVNSRYIISSVPNTSNSSAIRSAVTHNGGALNTANAGGGGSHNHSHNLSGNVNGAPGSGNLALSSATASIDVQYVDVIIATKD